MSKQIYSGILIEPVFYRSTANSRYRNFLYKLFIAVTAISVISLFTTAFASNSINSGISAEIDFSLLIDSLNNAEIVYFDFGSSDLTTESETILTELSELLLFNKDYSIRLTGYTDNRGGDEFNYKLSLNRAESVKQFLISKGVEENRILTEGKGESEPAGDNFDFLGRKLNRRVIFTLVKNEVINNNTSVNNSIPEIHYPELEFVNDEVNTVMNPVNRNELTADISVRDSNGIPYDNLNLSDISAKLKWERSGKQDSAEGYPRLIPINDKKKLAITLTMDYSGSMYGDDKANINTSKSPNILQMEKSVEQFIKQMNNKMYGKIIKFGSTVNVTSRFTASREVLQNSLIGNTYPMGGTALYQSIYTALCDTTYQSNPTIMKTIIAFTDGMENASKNITLDSLYNRSIATNTKIFTVGLFDRTGLYVATEYEIAKGKRDLYDIAQRSGGFFYNALNANMLNAIYDNIFKQVLNSYSVSIVWNSSKLPPKGTQVKAELKVNVTGNLRTFYKYYIID